MTRITALAAAIMCLAGCFLFDNPFDNPVTFQIVITSATYGGTYVWNPEHLAYEAIVGGLPRYVYMDIFGYWCLADQLSSTYIAGGIPHSVGPYGALPPSLPSEWTGSIVDGIDNADGGITAPGNTASILDTLQVNFVPGGSATYQWQGSSQANFATWFSLGPGSTASTYDIPGTPLPPAWIRVIVTPTESTGRTKGAPSISPPAPVN